jgi:hypothetical protein
MVAFGATKQSSGIWGIVPFTGSITGIIDKVEFLLLTAKIIVSAL